MGLWLDSFIIPTDLTVEAIRQRVETRTGLPRIAEESPSGDVVLHCPELKDGVSLRVSQG